MTKIFNHEEFIQYKAGEWGVTEEEARRRLEEEEKIVMEAVRNLPPEDKPEDPGPSWPFLSTEEINRAIRGGK